MPHPLEPDRSTLEHWLDTFGRLVFDHLDALASAPAVGEIGAAGNARAGAVSAPVSEEPLAGGAEEAAALIREAVPASLNTAGPGYLAYIPGGGLPTAALADFIAGSMNRFTGVATAAPALVRLEADVLSWLAREFGHGDRARGLLTSGGSLANFSAVVTAREELVGGDRDLRDAFVYTSGQAHHSVAKCVRLAGIPAANVREVRVDGAFRMDVEDLDAQLTRDREAGRLPFLVVAAAGTTNTGAVDPLHPIADACERHGAWLHVDGAYGGAFVLCEEGRRRLAGIERADTITFDPHKGLFLPYGTGCLLARDGEALRRAHQLGAHYLQDFEELDRDAEPPSPADYGPELSRSYRGLRLWLPLMLHGARAFREALTEKLELAGLIHDGLRRLEDRDRALEIVAAPQLSIVAFRAARRDGEGLADWNARNAVLNARINEGNRVYLSSTSLPVADGLAFTLRACVLSFRTHRERIDALLEDVERALGVA